MSLSLSDRPNSDSDSPSTNLTNSVSYTYTVRSINSRKSRLAVLYPRPVRLQRMSGVESIPESALTSLESLVPLSSRPVSISMSLQDNVNTFGDSKVSLSVEVEGPCHDWGQLLSVTARCGHDGNLVGTL
jgi:hypothetical protein